MWPLVATFKKVLIMPLSNPVEALAIVRAVADWAGNHNELSNNDFIFMLGGQANSVMLGGGALTVQQQLEIQAAYAFATGDTEWRYYD